MSTEMKDVSAKVKLTYLLCKLASKTLQRVHGSTG